MFSTKYGFIFFSFEQVFLWLFFQKAWLCVRNLVMRSLCQAVIAGQLSARQHQQNNNSNAIANGDKVSGQNHVQSIMGRH